MVRSVNLGRVGRVPGWAAGRTAIDKRPVDHPVQVTAPGPKGVGGSGLEGDAIASRRHHGGNDQAVYAYAREDLDAWAAELGRPLVSGGFGENLTTEGLDVSGAVVGDCWAIGPSLVLQVSDPRIPCRTFAAFLGERGWIRRFTERAACGTYLRVIRPGPVRAGDEIEVLDRPGHGVTVSQVFRGLTREPELLPSLLPATALSAEAQRSIARRTRSGGSPPAGG